MKLKIKETQLMQIQKICEVEINRTDNMNRKDVIEYFEKKNNVIEKVLRCDN